MARKELAGLRVAALVADGFEQVELTEPRKALERAGALVDIVSLRPGKIRGVNALYPGKKIEVDHLVQQANPDEYDALLLPGGLMNPDLLRQSEDARAFVRAFDEAGKPIAVICHGPWLLASADLVRGRSLTSWPGIKDDMLNAGALWEDKAVVHDGNWISSRGPHDLPKFNKAMVGLFKERAPEPVRGAESPSSGGTSLVWLVASLLIGGAIYAWRRAALGQPVPSAERSY
ncbi:MAG TPA: type 1 glutamine amidotransferase domain-containing protein [Roseiflexaceae bacterium]|nr:type 1 glutamine amidotransferase domain-containing protein [Roseiflexaceae bacterium]